MTGVVAQLVEHLLCKQRVVGSNPIFSTLYFSDWGLAQLVEREAVNFDVAGSIPASPASQCSSLCPFLPKGRAWSPEDS